MPEGGFRAGLLIGGLAVAVVALGVAVAVLLTQDDGDGATTVTDTATEATTETTSTREFSGSCDASREPTPTRTGFADLEVLEGSCEYAERVAVGFADVYTVRDCLEGCTKVIEGIRCENVAPTYSEVICAAARTEVRFTISGED